MDSLNLRRRDGATRAESTVAWCGVLAFPLGTSLTLTAVPQEGKALSHWQIFDPNFPDDANHAIIDTNASTTIVMNSDVHVNVAWVCGSQMGLMFPMVLGMLGLYALARRKPGRSGGEWTVNDLQAGGLAVELLLLAALGSDGRPPHLAEVPAAETMAYPSNPARMGIIAGSHITQMVAAANRPRFVARERSLLDQGSEVLVIRQPHGEVVKEPRWPGRRGQGASLAGKARSSGTAAHLESGR